jgi:hypothetical protein
VLHPCEVGVVGGRDAELPAFVVAQVFAAPVFHIERRIGKDVVRSEVGEAVVLERVALFNRAVDAADGEVHFGESPSGVVEFLPVDADVADASAVGADELLALHEHTRRAAAGVVDAPAVGLEHLHQQLDDTARGVELAALFAFRAGELTEKVFVDSSQDVVVRGCPRRRCECWRRGR